MLEHNHEKTASFGSWNSARKYRKKEKALIDAGDFEGAVQMGIDDNRSMHGSKYDDAIEEMLDYYKNKDLIN
jgi:hypothetical protein